MKKNSTNRTTILMLVLTAALLVPACKQTSDLKLYFSDGSFREANTNETAKSVYITSANGEAACSAGLIDVNIVITADHCEVGVGSNIIGGVSFLDRRDLFTLPRADGRVVETLAKGEYFGQGIVTITPEIPDGTAPIQESVELRRDVSIHRIEWNQNWVSSGKSQRQFVFDRIWARPEQYGLRKELISNRTNSAVSSIPINPNIRAYSVGFPNNQKEYWPDIGRETHVVRPMFSDGNILNLKASTDSSNTKSLYTLNLTTGTKEGNSGGFVAESGTDVLLGVVMGFDHAPGASVDSTVFHDPNGRSRHNNAVSLMDAYHFDPELGPVLRQMFDENGYRRNKVANEGRREEMDHVPTDKLAKVGFKPGASSTTVYLTLVEAVSELTVCGGTSISCAAMQNVSSIPRTNGVFLVEIDKTIPHEFKGTLPLVVRLKNQAGQSVEEVFTLERVL